MRKTILILVLIFSVACLQTTLPIAPTAPALMTGSQPTEPTESENPAGAVYEIPTLGPAKLCATVTAAEALHLRREPNEKAIVIDYLYNGEQVRVLDPNARWWKIRTARTQANIVGWVNSKFLQLEKCK